jgi:hypothetical protein
MTNNQSYIDALAAYADAPGPDTLARVNETQAEVIAAAALSALGRKAGSVKSERKARASRRNGRKGGRPRKTAKKA